jgi:2-isopropylmalate synthase
MVNDRVLIFDTTLRDGEQCPGASMTIQEKVQIAEMLVLLDVDIIEAGFAAASNADFRAIQEISNRFKSTVICSLSRSLRADIDLAAEALAPARRKRIHNFISTSPLHMKYKLKMSPDDVLEAIADSVAYARRFTDDVEWSCEDGTRSDPEFLKRCFDIAIKSGATTVNIADTVGYILPHEFSELIMNLMESVTGMEKVIFSVHCHDDLGLAVANSLAALSAGARQVECTINGLGERAGNASLEEIVMAIKVRGDTLKMETEINSKKLLSASELVSDITGFPVPPNKAIVGSNAFAHESGIHQHGVINHRRTYEIIDPDDVGAVGSQIVLGKHSGKKGLLEKCRKLGFDIGENALESLFSEFKLVCQNKFDITDEDLKALIESHLGKNDG